MTLETNTFSLKSDSQRWTNNLKTTNMSTLVNIELKNQLKKCNPLKKFIWNLIIVTLIYCTIQAPSKTYLFVDSTDVARPNQVLELTSDNFEASTSKYMIVVLNFYADWCPYSAKWKPVFSETANQVYKLTKDLDPNTIVFGFVNSVVETTLAQKFRVSKFPTTSLTIDGRIQKSEYRGARTEKAFSEYIMNILKDSVKYVNTYRELENSIDDTKPTMILFSGFSQEQNDKKPLSSPELEVYKRVARQYKDYCTFFYVLSHSGSDLRVSNESYKLGFKPDHKKLDEEIVYQGSIKDMTQLAEWSKRQCIPIVREITFKNAEELTEERLPFVILFYDQKDKSYIELFKRVIESELQAETNIVQFVYADGAVFSHPLYHLGKSIKDLPLIAIDSFRHLFLYKDTVDSISQPGKLKQFIADLQSGKLDREFHFGPDPIETNKVQPPKSSFRNLGPSPHRYSFPHDEL